MHPGSDGIDLPYPRRVVVETTTRCNLSCARCPKQSSGYGGSAPEPDADFPPVFFDRVIPALARAESLVLNGVGEPLLYTQLEALAAAAKAVVPAGALIGFQTNGQLLSDERALSLARAGVNRVCVSIDALDPELFGALRSGGSEAGAEAALTALRRAREAGFPLRIGAEFVARRANLDELPKVVERAAALGADYVAVSQLFPYDEEAVGDAAWDPTLDLAWELLARYTHEAAAAGLDLASYPRVYMKYTKSPEDLAVTRLVERMQDEAIAEGITLNVLRLFEADAGLRARSAAAFAAAEDAARRAGIELSLPAVSPRRQRSCEFVESGAVFISAAGSVHPCYFLWRRFNCYPGGWRQAVTPRSFGRLDEAELLAIWDGDEYKRFRANVTRYDYPYCMNCNLALCDYVQEEGFFQDCHQNAEPCAACLWCQGLFTCMT